MKKVILIIIGIAILAFLWWTISPLFINTEVQDELDPAIAALLESDSQPVVNRADPSAPPRQADFILPALESIGVSTTQPIMEMNEDGEQIAKISDAPETSAPAPGAAPGPVIRGPFQIEDTLGHPASGQIRVIETPEQSLVRFEDYNGTNGPDLRIYLATDLDATEFVDLGQTRGNMGNINYTIPEDIDIDDYRYVMTWCRAFGVLFDYAQIN